MLSAHAAWSAAAVDCAAVPMAGERFSLRQFIVDGNTLVPTDRLMPVLNTYLGEAQSADAVMQARDAVLQAYREAGYDMISVALPSAIGMDGSVCLHVQEMRIGQITVGGNRHFPAKGVRSALPALRAQQSPDFRHLARQLFLANDNPARQLGLAFSPGANGTANVDIKVADEPPLKMALSADNTGTRSTGRSRATLFATHANLWDAGHEGTVSYTTSPEKPGQVRQLALLYQLPLPSLGDRVQLSYTDSNTDAGRVADTFNVAGKGNTAGVRYQRFLHRTTASRHSAEFGIDDKRYNNTLDFFGADLGVDVNARPLSLGYQYAGQGSTGSTIANISLARNVPGGAHNDDATYGASRSGATASWSVVRAYLDLRAGSRSEWSLHAVFEGQYTRAPLISGELFGLGGARSVRGFPERESSGDRGWRLSTEVISPLLDGQHRLLAFIDGGRQSRLKALPGESTGEALLSYGLGWRWNLASTLYASLDWARVANGTPDIHSGHHAVHCSAVWRFL